MSKGQGHQLHDVVHDAVGTRLIVCGRVKFTAVCYKGQGHSSVEI